MKVSKTGYKKTSKDKNQPELLIPSNKITMKGVEFPVLGTDDTGYSQMMYPGLDYSFPGSYVHELPMAKNGMSAPGPSKVIGGKLEISYDKDRNIYLRSLDSDTWAKIEGDKAKEFRTKFAQYLPGYFDPAGSIKQISKKAAKEVGAKRQIIDDKPKYQEIQKPVETAQETVQTPQSPLQQIAEGVPPMLAKSAAQPSFGDRILSEIGNPEKIRQTKLQSKYQTSPDYHVTPYSSVNQANKEYEKTIDYKLRYKNLNDYSTEDIPKIQEKLYNEGYLQKPEQLDISTFKSKDQVIELQKKLAKFGLMDMLGKGGPNKDGITGTLTKETKDAVKRFNELNKTYKPGELDDMTKQAIKDFKNSTDSKNAMGLPIVNPKELYDPETGEPYTDKTYEAMSVFENSLRSKGYFLGDEGYDISESVAANPKISFNFTLSPDSTTAFGHCAQYVNGTVCKEDIVGEEARDELGFKGSAWHISENLQEKGGQLVFAGLPDRSSINLNGKNEIRNYLKSQLTSPDIKAQLQNIVGDGNIYGETTKIRPGDVVNIFYEGSGFTEEAYDQTKSLNNRFFTTHVGIVKADKGGNLYVEHNIHGKIEKDKIQDFIDGKIKGNGNNRVSLISGITRPNYVDGVDKDAKIPVTGVSYYQTEEGKFKPRGVFANPGDFLAQGISGENTHKYLTTIEKNKNKLLKDIPISETEFGKLMRVARVIPTMETYASTDPNVLDWRPVNDKELKNVKVHVDALKLKEGVGLDEVSMGFTRLKDASNLGEDLRQKLYQNDDKQLNDPVKAAIPTFYLLSKNYLYLKEVANRNNIDITSDELAKLAGLAYNQSIGKIAGELVDKGSYQNYYNYRVKTATDPGGQFKYRKVMDLYDTQTMKEGGITAPGRFRNPEGNWLNKYANGGDISIPDLSGPNWLDKAQKGQQVHQKIYYNPDEFRIANKAYNDSLDLSVEFPLPPKGYKIYPYEYADTAGFVVGTDSEGNDIIEYRLNKRAPIEPIGYTKHLANKSGKNFNKNTGKYQEFFDTERPIYKAPTEEPVYIAETRKDPYMPPSNTAEVLSQIKQEDLRKQGPKNVPAPDFRHGGWLDEYQGDEGSSQVERRDPNQPFFPSATEAGTYESQYSLPEVSVTPNWTEAELERNRLRDKYIKDDKKVWRHWYDKLGYDKDNVTKRANQFAYNKLAKQYLRGGKDNLTPEQRRFVERSEYAGRLQPNIGQRFAQGLKQTFDSRIPNSGINFETLGNVFAPFEYPTNLVRGAVKGDFKEALRGETPSPYFVSSDLAGTSPTEAAIASGLVDVGVDTGIGAFDPTSLSKGVKAATKPIKGVYNTVATGESFLPVAWKSPAVGLTQSASDDMFRSLVNSGKLTPEERALVLEYQHGSRNFTGRGLHKVNQEKRQALNNIINKYKTEIGDDVVLTRMFNDKPDALGATLENGRLNFGDRPTSFTAGVQPPGYGTSRNRLVIPKRYSKQMGDKFLVNQYDKPSEDVLRYLDDETKDWASWLGTNANVEQERELIGTGLDFRQIGKVKNDIGGYDLIVKPNNPTTKFADLNQPVKYRKGLVEDYNPETQMYEMYEVNLPSRITPGRPYEDVQHKMRSLRKDLGIGYIEHLANKYIPGFAKQYPLDKGSGLVIDPQSGRLFDSNTRYWLNREYGITPKIDPLLQDRARYIGRNYGTKISESAEPVHKTPGIKWQREPSNTEDFMSSKLPGSLNSKGPGPMMLGLPNYTHEVKNVDYFKKMLDSYGSNKLSSQSKKYFEGIINSVRKQEGLATKKQYDMLQRLRTGDFNYGKKEYGGWLHRYQDGSQVPQSWKDKYDWTPNVEEEYQMFKNDPNAPENLRFTDDMKDYNTRGMWDSLDRPSNWQQALDLFKQQQGYEWTPEDDGYYHAWSQHPGTGEWLKPKHHSTGWMNYMGYAFDPNTTAVVNPEGFFGNETLQAYPRKKNGGIKSSGEGYYDYINGYSGIFAKGGAYSKKTSWLNKYK